eukprot:5617940-Amphidinium_carterae.1
MNCQTQKKESYCEDTYYSNAPKETVGNGFVLPLQALRTSSGITFLIVTLRKTTLPIHATLTSHKQCNLCALTQPLSNSEIASEC